MKKIIYTLIMLVYVLTIDIHAYSDVTSVEIINGSKYVKVRIKCDGEECKFTKNDFDLERIKSIAGLKSIKSWSRIIENGNLKLYKIEYKKNIKILTYIICNSIDNKMIDNSYGAEILYKDN